jgi:dipeptidyl aminopeptidase/acylaminoacyl peptidase
MRVKVAVCAALAVARIYTCGAFGATPRVREPIPLEIVTQEFAHETRASFDLSPNGQWLAHTYSVPDAVHLDQSLFSPTGVTLALGARRVQAQLTQTQGEEVIKLGARNCSSWDAVWSPDGMHVAFYSDAGGSAGVWIWDMATRKAERVRNVIARPFFEFEAVRWSADSRYLLSKILPSEMTVEEANALSSTASTENDMRTRKDGDGPSITVFRAENSSIGATANSMSDSKERNGIEAHLADLALLDRLTGAVVRIAPHSHVRWYSFSPDQRYVAYTDFTGIEAKTQQSNYDLKVREIERGNTVTLATDIRLHYGIEVSWSPDSQRLAYIEGGPRATGNLRVVSLAEKGVVPLVQSDTPSFDTSPGQRPPVWDETGKYIFCIGRDGRLWRTDLATGRSSPWVSIVGHTITGVVSRGNSPTLWTTEKRRTAWLMVREVGKTGEIPKSGIYKVDLRTGDVRLVLEERRSYLTVLTLDASAIAGKMAYISEDAGHQEDGWLFDTRSGRSHQVTHLNSVGDRYELGTVQMIRWMSLDGQVLHGALLLPPGYEPGKKVPLVVWVYGGDNGSESAGSYNFGWGAGEFNFQLLATRGYAVLYPDAPIGIGQPAKDLFNAVIPGVDAAIGQGYADPDRLAIMGQSYGAYCTLVLITQTDRFKAAVISTTAVGPDLVGAYLQMTPSGNSDTTYFESGQGSMGGALWQVPQRYISNSPVFSFEKIQTPLLIGEGDSAGTLQAANVTFVALRRLGKEVEYRIYHGEGHELKRPDNVLDFWRRRVSFLDEHLAISRDRYGQIIYGSGNSLIQAKKE